MAVQFGSRITVPSRFLLSRNASVLLFDPDFDFDNGKSPTLIQHDLRDPIPGERRGYLFQRLGV